MPKDDEGQVFDVSKPNRNAPDPTSRPIIVGHQPMMSDPMVRGEPATTQPPPPTSEHKTITINAPDDDQPSEAPVTNSEPQIPKVAPEHPESIVAAAATAPIAEQAAQALPPGELHLTPVDDLIGHPHHANLHHSGHQPTHQVTEPQMHHQTKDKGSKRGLWVLLLLLLLVVAGYLALDARLIKTSIKLPFHIFKQPAPVTVQTVNTSASAAGVTKIPVTTDPYANWKTFKLSNEELTFQYPSAWTITDNTAKVNDKGDSIIIRGTNGFQMTVDTGLEDYSLPAGGATVDSTNPIAFLGQQAYMDLCQTGSQNTSSISFTNVSTSNTDPTKFMPTKNISGSSIKISMYYLGSDGKSVLAKSQSFVKADSNYIDTKLMLQSMHY